MDRKMKTYKFVIPTRLPGLNEIIEEARKNPYASAKQKKYYTELVRDCFTLAYRFKIPVVKAPIWLKCTWVEENKRRNPDNIAAAKKYILDGLVKAGAIKNDGWDEIAGFTDKWKVGSECGVFVEIKEV